MSRRRKLGRVTRDRWFESGFLQRRVYEHRFLSGGAASAVSICEVKVLHQRYMRLMAELLPSFPAYSRQRFEYAVRARRHLDIPSMQEGFRRRSGGFSALFKSDAIR